MILIWRIGEFFTISKKFTNSITKITKKLVSCIGTVEAVAATLPLHNLSFEIAHHFLLCKFVLYVSIHIQLRTYDNTEIRTNVFFEDSFSMAVLCSGCAMHFQECTYTLSNLL